MKIHILRPHRALFTLAGCLSVAGAISSSVAQAADPTLTLTARPTETPSQRDARMKWWREARFGMFIHWGVYSVPAGTYKGQQISGIGEWIMLNGKIPVSEYREYAKQFNPVKYNPDEWVRLAKEAGMKYIVITSKHHDGFALFDSKASDWNVVKSTPYGKDLLKPLAEACRKHGMKLGFYYSQAQDWNHPGGAASRGGHWDPAQNGDMDQYLRNIALTQLREIFTNYGDVATLWWDTPVDMTTERAEILLPALKLQPHIVMNNRLGGGYPGDTETPEQYIPPTGFPNRDWEVCMTMNNTWGYKSYDNNWKSTETLIRNLVDIASKGGNYLLNVGPTSEGLIPDPSIERLQQVGKWMKENGDSIYATSASPFRRLAWGRCTQKAAGNDTLLYLHVFDWPKDGKLTIPGLKNAVQDAQLLVGKQKLRAVSGIDGVTIDVPATSPDAVSSTIVLKVKGKPDVAPYRLEPNADGSLLLTAADSTLHGEQIRLEIARNKNDIAWGTDPAAWAEWPLRIKNAGTFEVSADISSLGTGSFEVMLGNQKVTAVAPNTGNYNTFQTVNLGRFQVTTPGDLTLTIKPVAQGWQQITLKSIQLKPVN